jgi:hypothetical protein
LVTPLRPPSSQWSSWKLPCLPQRTTTWHWQPWDT